MPATVSSNPQSINAYRKQSTDAVEKLRINSKKTEEYLKAAQEEGWNDAKFQQFQNNFTTSTIQDINPLCDVLTDYSDNVLFELETKLNNYLGLNVNL